LDLWKEELTEEQKTELIEKFVSEVEKRHLQAPAVLYLEMYKPLANVFSQAAVVFSPFIIPFLGFNAVNDYSRLLSDRDTVERLIEAIELSAAKAKGVKA
jgi:hypothetical protein